jgi:hypothetical protein
VPNAESHCNQLKLGHTLLYAPDVAVAADAGKAYNIQDWARVYLKEHIDLVSGNRKPNSDAQGDS